MQDDGDLVLGHRLGVGGAATIFAARWRGCEVSAKVAHASDDDQAGDLAVEADVLSRISHASLLEVLATGELPDGRPYLILPLLHGEDLAARLRRGPLPVPAALEVIAAVGGALLALHAADVVHRDIKPENVFLDDRGVFLLDLGLARNIATGAVSWRVRGTYDVMAPERIYGEPAGIASEVYELAALAWAALTGALPWPSGAAPAARRGIPPLAIAGDTGTALDAVLRGALSTVPERRPASVGALVTALREAARDPAPFLAARRTAELGRAGAQAPATLAMQAAGSARVRPRRHVRRIALAASLVAAFVGAFLVARPPADRDADAALAPAPAPSSRPGAIAAPSGRGADAPVAPSTAHGPAAARSRSVRVLVRPATARVVIDGALVTGERVELTPGRHDLRATAPGYQPLRRVIDPATLGDALAVQLTRPRRVTEPARRPDPAKQPEPRKPDADLPPLRSLLEM